MDACAIDAGDGATMDRVLSFTQPRLARRVVAVKGAPGNRPAIRASETRRQRLFIGVGGLKANFVERLRRGRSVRFSDTLEGRFVEELPAGVGRCATPAAYRPRTGKESRDARRRA